MELLPLYVKAVFILTTLLAVLLLYKASGYSTRLLSGIAVWLVVQAIMGLSGFYTVTMVMPPRFALLVVPPVIVILTLLATKAGRKFINSFSIRALTLLHIVRLPVELTLYWLFVHKAVPEIMTFEGHNFDVLSGLTAPFIYYFGYVKNVLGKKVIIAWNLVCLLLLANVVITAILSAPFPIQQFGFDQPNVALLYFPFVWLPCCVVPIVLFAHLAALWQLMHKRVV